MALRIQNKFSLEQEVFLKSDPDQWPRLITYIKITPNGLLYGLALGDAGESEHYDVEIMDERRVI